MQFELTEEQQQFADALRRWTERGYGFEHRQKAVRGAGGHGGDWTALAELGLTALGVPQDQGGLEAGGIEHLIAMQQMGRALTQPFQVNVIHADHFPAMNVDNLAINQVLLKEEVVALVLQWTEFTG